MKKDNDIIKILIVVFAVLIAALVIGGGIYLLTASKKVTSLTLAPDFSETELGIGSEYIFTVSATPAKASLKKVECVCDDPNATFEMGKDGKATLVTGATEGTVTVYVQYKKIESNVLTFQVVDIAAREAEEAAAAEAAAQAEAEAAAAEAAAAEAEAEVKMYVKMTGDNVNIRAENNTDCDVLGKAKKGDMFEKVETVDDWTHIIYNGQDGYIKTEYLTDITEEEYNGGSSDSSDSSETASETKTEEKKEETTAEDTAAAEAAAAEAAAKAAEEEAQKALEEAAAAQAALAAQATAGLTPIACKDGTCYVTAAQLQKIHATWDFAGDAIEMAGHHNIGELEAVIGATQH